MGSALAAVRAVRVAANLARLAERPERFPGALLIAGASEGRLFDEARRLAARLLCPGSDPPIACGSCRRVLAGLHPDVFVVEPDGVQIRVDRVREALTFGAGRPYEAARRVAIVSRADLLGLEAGNALLKSLEEPGKDFRWILTSSRPETLLPTILSRCALVTLPGPPRPERERGWRERGFSEEDARDLVFLGPELAEDAAEKLVEYRGERQRIVEALTAGLCRRDLAPLVLLAEELARLEPPTSHLATELLADAALPADAPPDAMRHPAVAGAIRQIGSRVPAEALRRAALKAVDGPPDSRRGNKRLHWEAVLLELFEAGSASAG